MAKSNRTATRKGVKPMSDLQLQQKIIAAWHRGCRGRRGYAVEICALVRRLSASGRLGGRGKGK